MVRTLEPVEIFAAKANALMSRAAARDLYDFNNMIYFDLIDGLEFSKIRRDLFPVLRKKDNFNLDERKEEAIKFIKELMVLTFHGTF